MRFPMGFALSQCNFLYSVVVCIASFNPNRPLGFLMILRVICNKLGINMNNRETFLTSTIYILPPSPDGRLYAADVRPFIAR